MVYPPASQVQPLPGLDSRHVPGDGHQVGSAQNQEAADGETRLLGAVDQPFDLAAQLFQVVSHGINDTHAQGYRRRGSERHRYRHRRLRQEGIRGQSTAAGTPGRRTGTVADVTHRCNDATGTVAQRVFCTVEDTRGYLVSWRI